MADGRGSKIGETYVEVGAKITELQEGMKQAEAETRKTASKMNEALGTVGRGGTFDGISKGIKDSTAGVRNLLSAVVGVVGAFTRMLGLIGLVGTAVTAVAIGAKRMWDYFTGAADEAERVQKNMEDAAKAYERYVARVAAAAKNLPSPVPNLGATPAEINELDKQIARKATYLRQANNTISAETRQKYIDELAALELKRQQIQAASARAQEIERQSEAKAAEDALAKEAALEDKALQDTLAAMRKAREAEKAERKKDADELAAYMLDTALMVHRRQKELDDERADNLIKNAKAVQSAFDAVLKSQRGAMDSNKLAIDIGRLAAAVEDMARSPRGPGMVVGGGW